MSFLSRKLMNLNNKEGMKSEKSRRCFEATQKAIPKIKASKYQVQKKESEKEKSEKTKRLIGKAFNSE